MMSFMKRKVSVYLLLISMIFILSFNVLAGCADGDELEQLDPDRTQIYVGNYNGGFGEKYLENLKQRFEEAYKDVSYEDGKMGAQIMLEHDKDAYTIAQISKTIQSSHINVYFAQGKDFSPLAISGALMDITDIVQENLSEKYGEDNSIENKLTVSYQKFSQLNGKYFAVPHSNALQGIVYDIDLFDNKSLFIQAGGGYTDLEGNLSAGPDGETGTYDDGLPATYAEFFDLCDYMKNTLGITPLTWTGQFAHNYTTFLLNALWADYHGPEEVELRYNAGMKDGSLTEAVTDDSNYTDLVVLKPDGTIDFDANGNPKIERVKITLDNYKEISRQAGIYYALSFWKEIVDVDKGYYYKDAFTLTQSHVMAQQDFLFGSYEDQPIAMLIEGTWWENEADDAGTFNDAVSVFGPTAARNKRNFGFMPLPKQSAEKIGETPTLISGISTAFINANTTGGQAQLAKDFLQFTRTDQSLVDFLVDTGAPQPYDFDIPTQVREQLSGFTNSVLDIYEKSNRPERNITSPQLEQQISAIEYDLRLGYATIKVGTKDETYTRFLDGLRSDNLSAAEYFSGVVKRIRAK